MADRPWVRSQFNGICFGKMRNDNSRLNDTNGVRIWLDDVSISYFNHNGGVTKPWIYCQADRFEVKE